MFFVLITFKGRHYDIGCGIPCLRVGLKVRYLWWRSTCTPAFA